MTLTRPMTLLVAVVMLGPFLGGGAGVAVASAGALGPLHVPLPRAPFAATAGSPFAFVSNFENRGPGNWTATSGSATVVTSPSYLGEPALASTSTGGVPPLDQASRGIVPGAASAACEAERNCAQRSTGCFALARPHGFVGACGIGQRACVWASHAIEA